jgi:NAD(P)-dependent dehydrogenase (short-subunit alcohol dehydrogenase family)
MNQLSEKIALVTGASRGIGKATALKLARQGAKVLLHYAHSKDKAKFVRQTIIDSGGQAELVQADFSEMEEIDHLFEQIDKILSSRKLNILINNAGTPRLASNDEITEEQFSRLVQVNFKAPFFVTRKAIERMNDGGRIINISSRTSKTPTRHSGVYAMIKAAQDNFTVQMASQLGSRKITVNAVAPGPILTDMNRKVFEDEQVRQQVANHAAMKAIGDPDDVAGVVAFLASDDASWITGQWIEISGGLGLGH